MNELIALNKRCSGCEAEFFFQSNYCGNCGTPVGIGLERSMEFAPHEPNDNPPIVLTTDLSPLRRILDNRTAVIAILLCIGPLGLPALWLNRRFSTVTKTLTTVFYFLLTVLAPLALAWYWLEVPLRPLVDAFSEVNR